MVRSLRLLVVSVALGAWTVTAAPGAFASSADQLSQGTVNATTTSVSGNQTGQTFTAGITGQLTEIVIGELAQAAGGMGPLAVEIYETNIAGLPVGAPLATQVVPVSSVPSSGSAGSVTVTFTSPATVVAGTMYAFALVPQSGGLSVGVVSPGPYTRGRALDNGPAWAAFLGADPDLIFTTYVNAALDVTDAPQPVLQQFGMPVSGSCDAAQPAGLNWGGVASGGWGESWAQWMNGGLGGQVCTRTLFYSTAEATWVVG